MRRAAFVLLSISILALSSHPVFACGCNGPTWSASPNSGMAPLVVKVQGSLGDWAPALDIDMGGEEVFRRTFQWRDAAGECLGDAFGAQHEFFCTGTYEIKLVDPDYPDFPSTRSVTISAPPRYYLFVFAGDDDHEVYVATHVSSSERPFTYSTVDWGDGTSEMFTYTQRGLYAGSPNHSYVANGEYTATVKHHYMGQYCSWEQT